MAGGVRVAILVWPRVHSVGVHRQRVDFRECRMADAPKLDEMLPGCRRQIADIVRRERRSVAESALHR